MRLPSPWLQAAETALPCCPSFDSEEGLMKKLLVFAALSEGLTGLLLLVYPPLVIRLLLNSGVAGSGIIASRIAGASLIALSVACWPVRNMTQAFWGMFTYSSIATLYLGWVGIRG